MFASTSAISNSNCKPRAANNSLSEKARTLRLHRHANILPKPIRRPTEISIFRSPLLSSCRQVVRNWTRQNRVLTAIRPNRIISDAERTTVLENSNNMVAANVMAYFAKGREMKQQQLLAEQRAQEKAEQLAAAQEAARIAAEEKAKRAIITEAPVDWTFYMNSLGEGVYEMVANVKIAENWYIYSKNNTGDAPFALQFEFAPNDKVEYTELGVQEIGQLRSEYDALFDKQVNRYANEITFKRQVKFLDNVPVHGSVRFMCADAEQYLMPTRYNLRSMMRKCRIAY